MTSKKDQHSTSNGIFLQCCFLPANTMEKANLYILHLTNIYISKCEMITMNENTKILKVIKKVAKKTNNEYWFGELGNYEQNVCKDIINTRNIDDATDEINRRYL